MEKWNGKTALITGSSSGIGEAIVHDLVKHGTNVVALARRIEKLETLRDQLKGSKGKIIPVKCDVSDKSSINAAFEEIKRKVGGVHILVNNAGIVTNSTLLGDDEAIDDILTKTIKTNVTGLILVTRRAYKLMKETGEHGIIINIGSIVGHVNPFSPYSNNVYPGTKHAVRAITETMRHELIKFDDLKIRVCEISPGATETELLEAGGWLTTATKNSPSDYLKIPRLKAFNIAQAVLFMLMVPYEVNITEMIVKPVGEKI